MKDKEKIRAYVKRLQKPEGHGDYWKGYDSALEDVALFIDSLQKEQKFKVGQYIKQGNTTVQIVEISEMGYHCDNAYVPFTAQDHWELVEIKFKVGDTIRVKSMKVYDKTFIGKPAKIVGISSKGYLLDDGNICDFSLQKGWELVEEPDGYGISQEQVDRLINHMKEVKELLKKEEPVSDDLEKEISNNWETGYELGIGFSQYADVARHFANWQKQKDKEDIDDRIIEAYNRGLEQMKQQMMKDAIDAEVSMRIMPDSKDYVSFDTFHTDLCYNEGDKVKLVVIK